MNRILICLAGCLCLSIAAQAQFEKYNPYAQPEILEPVITPDGKVNWPKFYKSASLKNKFDGYFQIGACAGTNPRINDLLHRNEVDINGLPKTTIEGVVIGNQAGSVQMRDANGRLFALVVHPAGVSHVNVTGTMPPNQLRIGMIVRFSGKVDGQGTGLEPLSAIDVLSAGVDVEPESVEPHQMQTVTGTISRVLPNDRMQVTVRPGKLHRLTLTLADDVTINVNAHLPELVAMGDHVMAEGHVYTPPGNNPSTTLFTDKIDVIKLDRTPGPSRDDASQSTTDS